MGAGGRGWLGADTGGNTGVGVGMAWAGVPGQIGADPGMVGIDGTGGAIGGAVGVGVVGAAPLVVAVVESTLGAPGGGIGSDTGGGVGTGAAVGIAATAGMASAASDPADKPG